jgi:hypothetical protein
MGILLSCFGCETEATDSLAFRQSGSLSESDIRLSGSDLLPQHPRGMLIAQKRTTRNFVAKAVRIRSRTLLPCVWRATR